MRILEFGDPQKEKIILIHGFESPWQIWNDYIEHYQKDFCLLVPVLPGHDTENPADFSSFEPCAKELEDYLLAKYGSSVFAVYGMSMGGVLACHLWKNRRLEIRKLILESSPLLSYGKLMSKILINQYLDITHKAQKRDIKTVRQAVGSMVTEDKLEIFLELLDKISDATIVNYISAIGNFRLPEDIDSPETEIYYCFGGKPNEFIFRQTAAYIKKHYPRAEILCFKGKGHCEDALLNPAEHIKVLNAVLIAN